VNLPLDHEAEAAMTQVYLGALGREPELVWLPGPCDANVMAGVGETTVIFGPGTLPTGRRARLSSSRSPRS
jgi:acetylornithine deacetylase/succinyl-diaminopimelate desuccinylase-like protein